MSDPKPPQYPPDEHIVWDLAPVIERDASGSTALLPIVPELLDDNGSPRIGTLATIVDVVGGETSIREVLPQWIATSSLSLHVGHLPSRGTLRARPRVVRKGRTTLVMEVDLDHAETGEALGLSTLGFAILPKRNALQARVGWAEMPEPRTTFGAPDSGFTKPLLDTLGVRFDADEPSVTRLAVRPYVINTLGAMQGGVIAMLIDAAADRYARHVLGGPSRIRGLEIHYLKLARHGPVRADVRVLGRLTDGCLLRVELRDEGQDEVLNTVATVVAERVTSA